VNVTIGGVRRTIGDKHTEWDSFIAMSEIVFGILEVGIDGNDADHFNKTMASHGAVGDSESGLIELEDFNTSR
jgi:hypothetical protein